MPVINAVRPLQGAVETGGLELISLGTPRSARKPLELWGTGFPITGSKPYPT